MERKKFTNLIGLSVLAVFVVAILTVGAVRHARKKAESQEAIKAANQLASGFAAKNKKLVSRWANGEFRDPWAGPYILLSNDSSGVQLASKGPDGELGTEDDITSQIFVPKVETPPKKVSPPSPTKPSLFQKLRSFVSRENTDMKEKGDRVD